MSTRSESADHRTRELFFLDSSGNRIELRDQSWQPGMPTPTYEEIVSS